jgi:hypothetical protein
MSKDVQYQGGWFAQRGLDMYREVERITPFQFFVTQGGYNAGGVAASAGTHDREAVDVSGSLLTPDQRWTVVTNMRRVGFAAWIRTPAQGFPWHIHGVPINGDLSTGARAQVVQYSQHLNGLAGRGPDDGPTGYYDATWEKYTGGSSYRPPINTGGGNGGTKPKKDWFDMASKEDLTDVFRGEGVSGAGDRKYNGVGENTQAIHELGDRIEANLTGLAGKLDQLIAALEAKS